MKNALIIHGASGSPQENWFPWLKVQIEQINYSVSLPQFPTPDGQNLINWLNIARPLLGQLNDQSIIIGHSIGATFTLRLLEQLTHPITAAVLVAGFVDNLPDASLNAINHSFYDQPFNWERIRSRANHIIHFYSLNDPFVPLKSSQLLDHQLKIKPIIIPNGGHFNNASGFNQFHELLAVIKSSV